MRMSELTLFEVELLIILAIVIFHTFVQGADQYGRGYRDCNDKWTTMIQERAVARELADTKAKEPIKRGGK